MRCTWSLWSAWRVVVDWSLCQNEVKIIIAGILIVATPFTVVFLCNCRSCLGCSRTQWLNLTVSDISYSGVWVMSMCFVWSKPYVGELYLKDFSYSVKFPIFTVFLVHIGTTFVHDRYHGPIVAKLWGVHGAHTKWLIAIFQNCFHILSSRVSPVDLIC